MRRRRPWSAFKRKTADQGSARTVFRLMMIGYFEGCRGAAIDGGRRFVALREFLGLVLPEHRRIIDDSRTRRLIDIETHEAVFK